MSGLKSFVSRHLYVVLMVLIAGSYLMLSVELLLEGHTEGTQLVGLLASVAGLVMAGVALFVGPAVRNWLAVLFLALSITGLVGTFQHNEDRLEGEAAPPVLMAQSTAANTTIAYSRQEDDDDEAHEEEGYENGREDGEGGEDEAPPLAPLSLSGMSLMAAVVLLGVKKPGDS